MLVHLQGSVTETYYLQETVIRFLPKLHWDFSQELIGPIKIELITSPLAATCQSSFDLIFNILTLSPAPAY